MSTVAFVPGAPAAVFTGYADFAGSADSGSTATLDVPLPAAGARSASGTYLVTAWEDGDLDTALQIAVYNRVPVRTPTVVRVDQLVPLVGGPLLELDAGGSGAAAVQGWLIGASPAQIEFTLNDEASSAGGRVWVTVYAVGEAY